jgi:ATP-dependent RNA helicase RhlE
MSFIDLGLSEPLLKAVSEKGYTVPSPIQAKTIPVILQGKDVLASAQTGTGKTAGFTLPMLQLLAEKQTDGKRKVRALVLTPTRELAAQVHENVKAYSKHINIKSCVVYGGVNINPQINNLRAGVDVLVATPGRLLDLQGQRAVSLSNVEFLVLDEADRMLDMGFMRDITKILKMLPVKRQNLLFSATFSKEIRRMANNMLDNPIAIEAEPENTTAEKVIQKMYRVDKAAKMDIMTKMIIDEKWQQVLVFTRTKHGANRLTQKMVKSGIAAAAIHGDKSQGARTKALAGFKSGVNTVLVATDIAARGLDIPLLPHVVNYELPNVPEDYVHRIGRTGRAGASGEAISLVCNEEFDYVKSIEKLLGEKMPLGILKGHEPTEPNVATKRPVKQQQGRRNPGGNSNERSSSRATGNGRNPRAKKRY